MVEKLKVSAEIEEFISRLTQSERADLLESLRKRYTQERVDFWELIKGYNPNFGRN